MNYGMSQREKIAACVRRRTFSFVATSNEIWCIVHTHTVDTFHGFIHTMKLKQRARFSLILRHWKKFDEKI